MDKFGCIFDRMYMKLGSKLFRVKNQLFKRL